MKLDIRAFASSQTVAAAILYVVCSLFVKRKDTFFLSHACFKRSTNYSLSDVRENTFIDESPPIPIPTFINWIGLGLLPATAARIAGYALHADLSGLMRPLSLGGFVMGLLVVSIGWGLLSLIMASVYNSLTKNGVPTLFQQKI